MKQILLGLTVAAALANAATFKLDLADKSVVNGQELAPGEYKVSYNDQSVTLSKGKQSITAPAHVESAEAKSRTTVLRYDQDHDKMVLKEIRVGGSNTRLVLDQTQGQAAGAQ
jgi:hypothetical protein